MLAHDLRAQGERSHISLWDINRFEGWDRKEGFTNLLKKGYGGHVSHHERQWRQHGVRICVETSQA